MITLFSISTCVTIHNPEFLLTKTPEHEHERRARCKATTYCYQYLTKHRDKFQITTYTLTLTLTNCLTTMVCAFTSFLFQGMGGSQMISLISVYVVYFIADDRSAVFNTIWETEHNNAMNWNEWKTGMELLLPVVYWMTAVNRRMDTRGVHECIASLAS